MEQEFTSVLSPLPGFNSINCINKMGYQLSQVRCAKHLENCKGLWIRAKDLCLKKMLSYSLSSLHYPQHFSHLISLPCTDSPWAGLRSLC